MPGLPTGIQERVQGMRGSMGPLAQALLDRLLPMDTMPTVGTAVMGPGTGAVTGVLKHLATLRGKDLSKVMPQGPSNVPGAPQVKPMIEDAFDNYASKLAQLFGK